MKKKDTIFISCGIFQEELRHLAKEGLFSGKVMFLDAALHINFDKLKAHLEQALAEAQAAGAELKVIYGHCHPDMDDILARSGAKKIAAGNCIEAFIGREEIARLDAEAKTFFLTAGWVNNFENIFSAGLEEFGFDFSSMFGQYKRIVVFDTGIVPIDEEKVEKFSKFTGLPVERKPITLNHLVALIEEV
ncbi:MAG: DUF1638 domain-containing protein [Nitrospirae bacterium]|nr:DUF1638 domain-containing protein [Nitrospirota bacterium]